MAQARQLRISLRDAFFVITISALVIGAYILSAENSELSKTVAELKIQTASLDVKDASALNIVAIPDASSNRKEWRIQVPQNSGYEFYIACSHTNIPGDSTVAPDPKTSPTMMTKLSEHLYGDEILLRLSLDSDDPKIHWSIDGWMGSSFEVAKDQAVWGLPGVVTTIGGNGQTCSFKPGALAGLMSVVERTDRNTGKIINATQYTGTRVYLKSYKKMPNISIE